MFYWFHLSEIGQSNFTREGLLHRSDVGLRRGRSRSRRATATAVESDESSEDGKKNECFFHIINVC